MPTPKLLPALLAACIASTLAASAQTPADVTTRVAQQNALFEQYYQTQLRNRPEYATRVGDERYNALLSDESLAAINRRHSEDDAFLARINAIPTTGMADVDQTSHQLLARSLMQADEGFALKEYEMPVNQLGAPPTNFADLPLGMPFKTVKNYEDYLARLRAIPVSVDQTIDILRAGMRDNLMPPKFLLEKIPAQCEGVITSNPFLIPTTKYPASISADDQKRLTAAITAALNDRVFPSFRKFAAFIQTDYAPHGRAEISVETLPQGKQRYALAVRRSTTLSISASEVHTIGLHEVDRITAAMNKLAIQQGFKDVAAWRIAINADPKWKPTSSEQIVDDFRKYIAGMQPKLPTLFNLLPQAPVTVEGIPSFQAASPTHYNAGTPDGSRPGRVVVAVANPTSRTLVLDEAVAYHEGIPGHHMQISIAQQLPGLPKFRTQGGFYTAYVEGWALYAEELGKDIGFYQDPVSDYGRLNSELFRAVRLVVDTGIHDQGWTRQQVIDYMHANDVNDVLAQSETDRYIAWPAQALSYKMGQLKIRELRERARTKLGPSFDIKTFHDEILNGGALPLDMLDTRVDTWINSQPTK